jgi:hypothetical protein
MRRCVSRCGAQHQEGGKKKVNSDGDGSEVRSEEMKREKKEIEWESDCIEQYLLPSVWTYDGLGRSRSNWAASLSQSDTQRRCEPLSASHAGSSEPRPLQRSCSCSTRTGRGQAGPAHGRGRW